MTSTPKTLTVLAAAAGLALSACSSEPEPVAEGPLDVIVSTTVLGDITREIVECVGGNVEVLMPIGADPHDFSASSAQVARMVNANIVIVNGLELESGLESSLEGAASDGARIFEVAPLLDPIPFSGEKGDDHGDDHDHGHGDLDPHVWFDMNRMATAAELIGAELGRISVETSAYEACGAETAAEIRAAEGDVRAILESVPADQRVLVTDHDALGYLADTYDYSVAGTVIPSGTTLASASSADLANLASTMKEQGVTTIFANVAEPTKLADAVAAEVGGDVRVVPLFTGTLGDVGSGAETYIGMMTTNASLIADNLQR